MQKFEFSVQNCCDLLKLGKVDLRIDIKVPRMTEKCFWDPTFLVLLQLALDASLIPQEISRCDHRRMEIQTQRNED